MSRKTMRNLFKRSILLLAVFLIVYPAAVFARDNQTETKKGCLKATINAVRMEIDDYGQRLKLAQRGVGPAGNAERFQKTIVELRAELKKLTDMKPADYTLLRGDAANNLSFFDKMQHVGPIMPPEKQKVSIFADRKCGNGAILDVAGMTRSGPFYHVAGIVNDDYGRIEPNKKYELTIYLVYKRKYFGLIPDYYVYIARVRKSSSP